MAPCLGFAQGGESIDNIDSDDLNIGGDIFTDFSEEIVGAQMAEDERFYRFGRFFSFALGLGLTTYDGNRGAAYQDELPAYGLYLNFFMDFQNSFSVGLEFSKHNFFLAEPTQGFQQNPVGFVRVNALRAFFGYRYYMDTSNLGTAITYANPYFTGRIEYWYLTNKFVDQEALPDDSGGGLGFGLGFGLEFPVKLKENYIGVEFLFHSVNFHDKFDRKYASFNGGSGFEDLTGNAYSTMVSYVLAW